MSRRDQKLCFVISPIGSPDSDVRKYSDVFLEFIVGYSLGPLGYEIIRSDKIPEPGSINIQIIHRLICAEVVVADLTSNNPNVMYELAIRHASQKPAILMAREDEKLPFDIFDERTIFFDINDIESVEIARNELKRQVKCIESEEFIMVNPLSLIGEELRSVLVDKSKIPEKLIEILIEYEGPGESIKSKSLEISLEDSVSAVLTDIWLLLRNKDDSVFKPPPYTYLWDWILIRKKDKMPLIIRGVMNNIPASTLFRNKEVWIVKKLDEPILNKPERFGLERGSIHLW